MRKISSILILFVLLLNITELYAQSRNTETDLIARYKQGNYEKLYNEIQQLSQLSPNILILRALTLTKLPSNHEALRNINDPLIHALELIKEARGKLNKEAIHSENFFIKEFKELQNIIFSKGESWYKSGFKKKASRYFDAIHHAFNNTKSIFVNHYSFDEAYFLTHLINQIDIPVEFQDYYKENYDLLEKYYYGVEEFKEWNNPVYRMANTAKDIEYNDEDEKMVFYFLNLARMNPELFRKTFLYTRLHIRYHGDLNLQVPVYDSLDISKYGSSLSFDEFFKLPVHKLYNQDLPEKTVERFVKTKIIKKTPNSTKYSYEINYSGFYNYLETNHPELLNLRNISNYTKTKQGKEFILFKLYDKKFTIYQKSHKEATRDHYHQSLYTKLTEMDPMPIITPNKELFHLAECWAEEAGRRNLKGHDRVNCPYGYDSECCDYGNKNGLDVVLSLLIDRYVPDLGHRKVLLGSFSEMGVAIRPHQSSFKYNAVLDFFR